MEQPLLVYDCIFHLSCKSARPAIQARRMPKWRNLLMQSCDAKRHHWQHWTGRSGQNARREWNLLVRSLSEQTPKMISHPFSVLRGLEWWCRMWSIHLESATTPAWIACGQTGWKPDVVWRPQNQDFSPSLFLKSQSQASR